MAEAIVPEPKLKYGRWTILRPDPACLSGSERRLICRCDCGAERSVMERSLRRGLSKSCGCLLKELAAIRCRELLTQHGHAKAGAHTAEFGIWQAMKNRCRNKNMREYPGYGGRGIMVCREWSESFPKFLADMGPRPGPEYSIDRYPNNDGDYEPNNCRWATRQEQCNNTRSNVRLTYDGRTMTVSEWARCLGIKAGTIRTRLGQYGFSVERALTATVRPWTKHPR